MPVVGCGNGDGVNGLVLEELADINKGLGPASPLQQVLIHVTKRRDLHIGQPGKASQVVLAPTVKATDGYTNPIIGTEDFLRAAEECDTPEHGQTRRGLSALFEKVPTSNP